MLGPEMSRGGVPHSKLNYSIALLQWQEKGLSAGGQFASKSCWQVPTCQNIIPFLWIRRKVCLLELLHVDIAFLRSGRRQRLFPGSFSCLLVYGQDRLQLYWCQQRSRLMGNHVHLVLLRSVLNPCCPLHSVLRDGRRRIPSWLQSGITQLDFFPHPVAVTVTVKQLKNMHQMLGLHAVVLIMSFLVLCTWE